MEKAIADAVPCSCIDAYKLRGLSAPDCAYHNHAEDVKDLIARVRASTEAAVTKREREKASSVVDALKFLLRKEDSRGRLRWLQGEIHLTADEVKASIDILAAYKSNDAGEKP